MGPEDAGFGLTYPALYEHLTVSILGDGPRQTSTLLVFVEDSMFKGCLHDRDAMLQLFRASKTFSGLLEALEQAIQKGDGDWRPSRARRKGG